MDKCPDYQGVKCTTRQALQAATHFSHSLTESSEDIGMELIMATLRL